MAEENKNLDPEDERNSGANDDDFGLPDFEFEALDDDDDLDEALEALESEDIDLDLDEPKASSSEEEVPSIDDTDLEDLDIMVGGELADVDVEGLDDLDLNDIDLGDIDDLDVGDLDLEDIDLDNLDLDDVDGDLSDLDAAIEETSVDEVEIDDDASGEKNLDDLDIDADGDDLSLESDDFDFSDEDFYEEESFDDDEGSGSAEKVATVIDDAGETGAADLESIDESDLDSLDEELNPVDGSIFEMDDDSDIDLGEDDLEGIDLDDDMDEPVPFAKRDVKQEYVGTFAGESDEDEVEVSEGEVRKSRAKFIRIVVLGTLMFVVIGAGFLYWNGTLGFSGDGEKESKEVAENKKAESSETKAATSKLKATTSPTKKEPAKTTPSSTKQTSSNTSKQTSTTTPKQTTTKPATQTRPATTSGGGVEVLRDRTNRRHLIVASFSSEKAALEHANKLVSQGDTPKVIPPFNDAPNYRVSIASYTTQGEALGALEGFRQRYGSGVWILRY